jgi:hypothetical protein
VQRTVRAGLMPFPRVPFEGVRVARPAAAGRTALIQNKYEYDP